MEKKGPSRKPHYSSYKSSSQEEIDALIERDPQNKERRYMKDLVSPSKNYLNDHGITVRQDYISILQKNGYKSPHIIKFCLSFADYLNIGWLNKRTFKKANFQEKNIIINRIVLQYESEFINFIQSKIPPNLPEIIDKRAFIQEFIDKINLAKQQAQENNLQQSNLTIMDYSDKSIADFDLSQSEYDANDDSSFLLGNMFYQV